MSTLSDKIKKKREAQGINPPDCAKPDPVEPYVPDPHPRPLPAGALEVSSPVAETLSTKTGTATSLVLYIDCRPDKETGLLLSEEIERRTPSVIDAVRAREPNAVPSDCVDVREIKFGAGTTALLADFKRTPPTGIVFASSIGLSGQVSELLSSLPGVKVTRSTR